MDLLDLMGPYPTTPGHQRTETSRAAAASMVPTVGNLRNAVLAVIERSQGLTPDQIAGRLGISVLTARPRCSELMTLGLIRDTGERRKNGSGRSAAVLMAITPARLKRP